MKRYTKITATVLAVGLGSMAIAQIRAQSMPATMPAAMVASTAPALGAASEPVAMGTPATAPLSTSATTRPATPDREGDRRGRDDRRDSHWRPTTDASAQAIAEPRPMATAFDSLNRRSIFYKGHLPLNDRSDTTRESRNTATDLPNVAPAMLIFNGVIFAPGQTFAFVENLAAGKVATVCVGDAVAGGKVADIGFDELIFESQGQRIKVEIGHNFNGEIMAATTPTPMAPTTQAVADASGTVSPTSAPATADSGSNDILERMRRRRLQEMGGGK